MAQAPAAADRLTPALVALTGYYVVAGFASLTNIAVAVWVMGLVYCVPVVAVGVALAWVGARRRAVQRFRMTVSESRFLTPARLAR